MSAENNNFASLCNQATQLLQQGRQLYQSCAQAYCQASPQAVENPKQFQQQIQDLFRGLVLRIVHGMVLADRRLSSRELALSKHLFSKLWDKPFSDEETRGILVRHSEQESYRWEDLLWPFERLAPFQKRVNELETLALRLAQIFKLVDGLVRNEEVNYLHWLTGELQRVLHPIRVDVSGPEEYPALVTAPVAASAGPMPRKSAVQTQTAQAQQDLKPLPVPPELISLDELLKELDSLVGLAGVKRDVTELIHFLQMQNQRKSHGLPVTSISLHAIFSGNPGTG